MNDEVIYKLTAENDKFACAIAGQIIAESQKTNVWYEHFDAFASLLGHSKSLVRNRALHILAANAQWDGENRFDAVLSAFLAHIADEKPVTARQCIQALIPLGRAKPQYVPLILDTLRKADLSKYKDSMRPLIEKDIQNTITALTA